MRNIMDDITKKSLCRVLFIFLVGVIIGAGITGLAFLIHRSSGQPNELAREYSDSQRESKDIIAELEQSVARYTDIIRDLEASNSELEQRIRNAGHTTKLLIEGAGKAGDDIQEAIRISRVITASLKIIQNQLNGIDTK